MAIDNLAVIIVNYNSASSTIKLVNNLKSKTDIGSQQIFVVNNGSSDNSNIILSESLNPNVNYIDNVENLGFGGGVNTALHEINKLDFEFIAILNTDIDFDSNFFKPLITFLKDHDRVGVVGPVIKNKATSRYDVGGKINLYSGNTITNSLTSTKELQQKCVNEGIDVDWIIGAVMLFRTKVFLDVGFFPENYFLNYEETEWQLRVKRSGWRVNIVCSTIVEHAVHEVIDQIDNLQLYFMIRNKIIFEKRNASTFQKVVFFSTNTFRNLKLKHTLRGSQKVVDLAVQDSKTGNNSFIDGKLKNI